MKKILKGIMCTALVGVLALSATGCKGKKKGGDSSDGGSGIDPETRALQMAIGAVDRKFNPLFYTAQNDGEIANMTQVSLMTVDASGKLAYGDDHPTVALDYLETYYDAGGMAIGYGDGNETTGDGSNEGYTTFEFVIKNGMKFSDGEDLTVMDVLFNLYIYLDPAYSGSSTIYSTKIEGMQKYRKQDPDAEDDGTGLDNDKYAADVAERMSNLYNWSDGKLKKEDLNAEQRENLENDFDKAKSLFESELNTDWNALENSWYETYKENYNFTAAWQAFYFAERVIKTQRSTVGNKEELKGADGKYLTTLDPEGGVEGAEVKAAEIIKDIEDASTDEKVAAFIKEHEGYTEEQARTELQRDFAIETVKAAYSNQTGIKDVLEYWQTGSLLEDYILADVRSKDKGDSDDVVPNISGITVYRTDKLINGYNSKKSKSYGEEHDVLKIKVKGIDPKAKWNFSFSVAPMHYYSDREHYNDAMKAYKKGYDEGGVYSSTCRDFGVSFDDRSWLDRTVGDETKTRLPLGAGAYKATSWKHDGSKPDGNTFFYANVAYYERNEYFETMGANIENAKIKYVNYKVLPDDKIIENLASGEVDYGQPNARAKNYEEIEKYDQLDTVSYFTGGYGYVGINPQFVPELELRQAIMRSFNTASIMEYYGGDWVNPIYRPVSTTSWAYPEKAERYYPQATDVDEIIDLVCGKTDAEKKKSNYEYKNGKIVKKSDGQVLKITFTIAGESSDHPAYEMFKEAEAFLEDCGMEISVVTDAQALMNLASGKLAVWAAAWSSSIDPDPYQLYSMYSNATSTKNWYKDGIVKDDGSKYGREKAIAADLTDLIEQGRQTLNQDERKMLYARGYDLIMDLAVEFPTYQRKDMCVFNKNVLDKDTFTEASDIMGPLGELWKVNYVK